MNQKTHSPDDELRQLLRETSGASPQASPRQAKTAPVAPTESLEELLRSTAGNGQKKPSAAATSPAATQQLQQVLSETHGQASKREISRPSQTPVADSVNDLGQILLDSQPNQQVGAPENMESDLPRSRWLTRLAGGLAILLLVGAVFIWPEKKLDGPPGTLQQLAKAVEQHRQQSGNLPAQLAKLDGFPKNAVEWPAKHWNARDAAGRTEIVWVPNGNTHYSIVWRQGVDAWVYGDKEGKSCLVAK